MTIQPPSLSLNPLPDPPDPARRDAPLARQAGSESNLVSIRRAHPGDHLLLFELGVETFFDAFGPHNTPSNMEIYLKAAFSPAIQAAELAEPSSVFLIAEVDAQTAGYARLLEGQPPSGAAGSRAIELVRLYARTRRIGHGVGAALMQACLAEAAARGCDTIWLGVWERNRRAIAFYERWGFRRVGSHPFQLGDDLQTDLVMQRPVALSGVS
jgi:ribosomal protein S18 acetylase RimI-like enzyme